MIPKEADKFYEEQKTKVKELRSILSINGLISNIWSYKDKAIQRMAEKKKPSKPSKPSKPAKNHEDSEVKPPSTKKSINNVYRQMLFASTTLESQEDIDAYVENIRKRLTSYMEGFDGIELI